MTFDWTQYLRLAEELAGQGTAPPAPEARFRSAVSRAYYAAYCSARNQLGFPVPANVQNEHTYVWSQYRESRDIVRREIGENGFRLRKQRNTADYEDTVLNLPSRTAKALRVSRRIISQLARIR